MHICRGVEGVVGEVKSVSWGGARTKGEVHKRDITDFFPDTTIFTIKKLAMRTNDIKR